MPAVTQQFASPASPQSAMLSCFYLLRCQRRSKDEKKKTLIPSLEPHFHLPETCKENKIRRKRKESEGKARTIVTN